MKSYYEDGAVKRYSVIYADPPWSYNVAAPPSGKCAYRGGCPYPTMSAAEIKALPVRELAAPDCTLFMWATLPLLPVAFDVIAAWGFEYVTCAFVWIKQNRGAAARQGRRLPRGAEQAFDIFGGLGRWTRGNAEIVLLGRRGRPQRISKSVKQIVVSPVSRHSEKPEEVRSRIVQLMGDVPRVELFARQRVEGWDQFGNDLDGRDIREALSASTARPSPALQESHHVSGCYTASISE
ncbi:MAG TPA: MT-A70 family methyltransferase [Pyrinomonadaceae bacterium]|nr:MT-A70 family methyltransferase [Pyrinomonadaceae bacterium]